MSDVNTKDQQQTAAPAVEKPALHADRSWYNSLFTQLLAPLVATRYVWLAIEDINPLNFLQKKPTNPGAPAWKEPSMMRYASRNFAAFGMGATFLGIIGLYSKNTLEDIKSVYAEAVGYELGKKTQDVGVSDIFMKSQNEALDVTRSAYIKRTLARVATAAAFFMPWHKLRDKAFASEKPKYDANANVGVGAIGVHLYSEGFLRQPSFFDLVQKMISSKINHKDVYSYATIQPQDIQALINLQDKHIKNAPPASGASADGQKDIVLSQRIAELMNQTYSNTERKEHAHFTVGKFIFLLGFKMLDHFPESLAYVELANKSTDMHEVKEAHAAIRAGQDPQAVFARHGVDMHKLAHKDKPEHKHHDHGHEKEKDEPQAAKFTDRHPAKTHHEHAAHTGHHAHLGA